MSDNQKLARAKILLKAAKDIIEAAEGDSALEAVAVWDEAECDGACLVQEIEDFLEIGR